MSPSPKEEPSNESTVTVTDDLGRELTCSVEYEMEIEGQDYVLLFPVDTPVELFTWYTDVEDEAAVPVEDEDEVDRVFDTAQAVLAEQNLVLKRTAVTLTVAGDLPEIPAEEMMGDSNNGQESEEYEELLLLANFFHEEQEYAVYAPLDHFYIVARVNEDGDPVLLTEEEFKRIEPMLPQFDEDFLDEEDDED